MEVKRINIMKDWPKFKSICNIQVFLDFANFYQQFIKSLNRIVAPLTSILKTIGLPDKPAPSKNNNSKSVSSRNNNSRPASGRNNGNDEVDEFGGIKHAKKSGKLKDQKLAKSQKLPKSRKSKSEKSKKSKKCGN